MTPHIPQPNSDVLLTVEQMYSADKLTINGGIPGKTLMENAGRACADAIADTWSPRPTVVLCGPGNNGGDGFVVARLLAERDWPVRLALLGERGKLSGDAALMAAKWDGECLALDTDVLRGAELVVDALFGAGLQRPLEGNVADIIDTINNAGLPVAAIDLPSGVDGNSGQVLGTAPVADLTITFARKKLGHVLAPGRFLCGNVVTADIGIPDQICDNLGVTCFENTPNLWRRAFPKLDPLGHKYARGHALVISGGPSTTGAARLGAMAALRAGAGLVTVASPPDALLVNACHLTTVMVRKFDGPAGLQDLLSDERKNAILIGPGCGVGEDTFRLVEVILKRNRATVLDADALTSFEDNPGRLLTLLNKTNNVVLTPHEGEFSRLFPHLKPEHEDKVARTQKAAIETGATVLLKGPDTVIAHPDGRTAVNTNAGPQLATAGAGDVLAGIICGLMAQGMHAFEASCAAAWLHGECGTVLGRGLIAEDLPEILPQVLQDMG